MTNDREPGKGHASDRTVELDATARLMTAATRADDRGELGS
ncbi:hypothetical protein [Bifidobacterium minimum]|nr:hypothetical protein [Bifidobacterium minimum]